MISPSDDPLSTLITVAGGPINVLVMGASSGIGLAMVSRLVAHSGVAMIHAASRHACDSLPLLALLQQYPDRLRLVDADIASEPDLSQLAATLRSHDSSLHLALNTVGLLHDSEIQPEKALQQVTSAGLARAFAVNAFGPILLGKALMPFFRHGGMAVFASLSARVGSISDNRLGGWYAYRAAKAAQNQLLKTFSIELARINRHAIVLALHPGTTDTPLSKPYQGNVRADALFSADYAASRLLEVISQRTPADTGGFFAWDGTHIPW